MKKKRKRKVLIKRMRKHLLLLIIGFSAAFIGIVGVTIYINITKGEKYSEKVLSQNNFESIAVPFKRGDILDTNGSVLATSKKVYNLVIEPKNILKAEDKGKATKAALKKYFNIPEEEFDKYMEDSESLYQVVRKELSYDEVNAFKQFEKTKAADDVTGIWFEDNYVRTYPNKELACHLLGFTVSGNEGLSGVEGQYNSELNGRDGRIYAYLASDYSLQKKIEPATDGNTLVTTIDIEAQRIVQENCEEFLKEKGAKNISVLVMNPKNCEILALYNAHQFDPNDAYDISKTKSVYEASTGDAISDEEYKKITDKMNDKETVEALNSLWRNFVLSDNFEPGSTFKTFTVAGAVEEGVVKADDTFFCGGHLQVEDCDINCHNTSGDGQLTVKQGLAQSCNVVLMHIAQLEGRTTFYKYQSLFGFGQRTNIDIEGEGRDEDLAYMVYDKDGLNPVELATSSFGQGVTVTMMQLATAFCSVINGGYYYQPHVVKQVLDSNGNLVKNYDKILVRRTISENTSAIMRDMLADVVDEGTGARANVEGYSIGGKTGTAEKIPRNQGNYILSFIGFAPVEDPQVVIYCVVDEPGGGNQSSSGAGALLFNKVAEDLLPYMNVYKTGEEGAASGAAKEEVATPLYNGDAPNGDTAPAANGVGTATSSDAE